MDELEVEWKETLQVSAGGVLYRRRDSALLVCLIAKHSGRVWALPKGRVNPGEEPRQTAKREILEETGHEAEVAEKIDEIDYHFYWKDNHTQYHKRVTFYLMPLMQENAQPRDQEACEVAWLPIDEACDRLTYANERNILRKAQQVLTSHAG